MEMDAANRDELLASLPKLHTTMLGAERVRKNLSLNATDDVVNWCREQIKNPAATIRKNGKNFYVQIDGCEITIHSRSCTIITAHRI